MDFFVGRNGRALLAKYKDWIGENQMRRLLSVMQSEEAKSVMRADYRPSFFIGDGGSAAMLKFEKATGLKFGRNGESHEEKVHDLIRQTEKVLLYELPGNDRIILEDLLKGYKEAVGE